MQVQTTQKKRLIFDWIMWPIVGVVGFLSAMLIVAVLLQILETIGFRMAISPVTATLAQSIIIYLLTLVITLWLARVVKQPVLRRELGLKILTWRDIGIAVSLFVVYVVVGSLALQAIVTIFPSFPISQPQDIGFKEIYGFERMLAFIVLVVVAPVVEELLFRGFLYGKLRSAKMRIVASVLITSVLFAVAHGQLNVGVDVFILSIFLCIAREYTRGIGAPILMHMMKNGIAFYVLFVAAENLTR